MGDARLEARSRALYANERGRGWIVPPPTAAADDQIMPPGATGWASAATGAHVINAKARMTHSIQRRTGIVGLQGMARQNKTQLGGWPIFTSETQDSLCNPDYQSSSCTTKHNSKAQI